MEWAIFDFFSLREWVFFGVIKFYFWVGIGSVGLFAENFFFLGTSVLKAQYSSTDMQVLQY